MATTTKLTLEQMIDDERRNSFEAFGEWFNEEVRSLEDIERNEEDYDEVIAEWCKNNNHQIREDGIYNMNIEKCVRKK